MHGPLALGGRRVRPAAEAYEAALAEVRHIVEFIACPTCDAHVVTAWARGERRARLTIETHAHYMGLDVGPLLEAVIEWLHSADGLDFETFVADIVPGVLANVDAIEPGVPLPAELAAPVYAFHYAVSLRTALVRVMLAHVDEHYPVPRFQSLREAAAWTQAFGELLEEVNAVLDGTRQLLQQETLAVQQFLDRSRRELRQLEVRLRAQGLQATPLTWADELQEAEATALDTLSAWAEALEKEAFSGLERARRSGVLELAAKHVARRTPRLALALVGLAAGATLVSHASPSSASWLPPLAERAREGLVSLPRVWSRAVEDVAERAPSGVRSRVRLFLDQLVGARERQTVEVEDGRTLAALLAELRRHGYQPEDVLRLLGLERVEDVDEQEEPVRLTLQATEEGVLVVPEREERSVPAVPQVIAAYRVQPGDTLWRLSRTFGVPISRILAVNPQLQDPDLIIVGEVLRIPGVTWAENRRQTEARIRWGSSLADIANAVGVPVEELAELNNIADPDGWMYDGRPLVLPVRVLRPEDAVPPAPGRAPDARTSPPAEPAGQDQARAPQSPESRDGVRQATSETGTTSTPRLRRGEISLERARDAGFVATTVPDGQALVAKYGDTLWPSIEAMPAEVRLYFVKTVQDVAEFFNVRPDDILGILKMENGGAGWRLYQPAVSAAGAKGVAQVITRTWNGWQNPIHDRHITNLADIERYGGIGFDWSKRELWKAWKEGRVPLEALANSNADPMIFENSVAAVARHLVRWGLTQDKVTADPAWFQQRLADAIAVYNSGRVLSESASWTQAPGNSTTVQEYVDGAMRTAQNLPELETIVRPPAWQALAISFRQAYEISFGVRLGDTEMIRLLEREPLIVGDVLSGKLTPTAGAQKLLEKVEQHYLAEGRAARQANAPLPWPYVYNAETLAAQKLAVAYLGHALTADEVERLVAESGGDVEVMERRLAERGDAIVVARAQAVMEEILGRPVARTEVATLVQPLVAGQDPYRMDAGTVEAIVEEVETRARAMREAERPAGERGYFRALPLNPMPRVFREFGAPVNYQAGGRHTGIDVGLPPGPNGQQPTLHAVDDGTVVYVGPLYCNAPRKCRGDKAIVIDHGNNVYSIYSHNSEAYVTSGQRVRAGQVIGRQGQRGLLLRQPPSLRGPRG
ncbi:MAG: LysM peptidoglycan-binding domain-containing protein [Ardenticatenia bacterium]|nr:LysM peptidoglycan-binding domain-containing protein [Ardenticatenia bacterium]